MIANRIVLLAFCLALASCAATDRDDPLEKVSWILGDWISDGEKSRITESWMAASPTTFEGAVAARDRKTGKIVSSESLRLVAMSGGIFYLAKVEENELPIPFKLVECSPQRAVFENSGHDFPRRIEYRLDETGGMTVTVGGGDGRGFHIAFRRSAGEENGLLPR